MKIILFALTMLINSSYAGVSAPFELLLIPFACVAIIFLNILLIAFFSKSESAIIVFLKLLIIHIVLVIIMISEDFLIGIMLVFVLSLIELFFIIIWLIVIYLEYHKSNRVRNVKS